MKIFNKNKKIFFILAMVIFAISFSSFAQVAYAVADPNVSGWAWSENIGWISFSCVNQASNLASWNPLTGIMSGYAWSENIGWLSFNCADNKVCSSTNQFCSIDSDCPGSETCVDSRDGCSLVSDYKVTINTTSGELSGYAWSDTLGWLSFNRGDTGVPPASPYNGSEAYIAKKSLLNITGWAKFLSTGGSWDGWIKFSCDGDECATSNFQTYFTGDYIGGYGWGSDVVGWLWFGGECPYYYGVQINETSKELSGEAWSENIGWISFDRTETGTPPAAPFNASETYTAKLDLGTNTLRGWARALEACKDNYWSGSACTNSGAGDESGGWDGWIKFQREEGSPVYIVSLNTSTKEFSGWATSDSISEFGTVGWISTNDKDYDGAAGPVDYQVITTLTTAFCSVSTTSETWSYCSDSRHPILTWSLSGECTLPQTSYQIQINDVNSFDASCTGCEIDTGEVSSSSLSYTTAYNFSYNTTYYWRVRSKDSTLTWSEWSTVDSFLTPLHSYPSTNFTWSPQTLRTNDFSYFYDDVNYSPLNYSKCYDSGGQEVSCSSRTWTFEGASAYCECSSPTCEDSTCLDDGDTRTEQGISSDPVGAKWGSRPSDGLATVSLEACDSNGYCCTKSYDISTVHYFKWREILPW
ncbi:MAG: hypothetical protein PHF44_03775 [Candidatus Pacebacteria bacterium]|nr:hypothetical protein [Candidatus Paceibacterota bacterium]